MHHKIKLAILFDFINTSYTFNNVIKSNPHIIIISFIIQALFCFWVFVLFICPWPVLLGLFIHSPFCSAVIPLSGPYTDFVLLNTTYHFHWDVHLCDFVKKSRLVWFRKWVKLVASTRVNGWNTSDRGSWSSAHHIAIMTAISRRDWDCVL